MIIKIDGRTVELPDAIGNAIVAAIDSLVPQSAGQGQPLGYVWQGVHLPPGTILSMKYKGRTFHATVEGNEIIWEGQAYSPSKWCSTIANGTFRNAWNDLFIRRPGDTLAMRARTLRGGA